MNKKIWSTEPGPSDGTRDVVLRTVLPNGGVYCHRYAIDSRRDGVEQLVPAVTAMDETLVHLLARGFAG